MIKNTQGEETTMEQNRVRIVDIAEELGLSTAIVSNVIHGKTKKLSKETVKRVQELLEERQYIPSMAGVALNTGLNYGLIFGKFGFSPMSVRG